MRKQPRRDARTIIDESKNKVINIDGQAEKSRKQVIIETAIELELKGMIPSDRICAFITKEFKGILKPRTIRKYLDEKYKIKTRVENARKQKNKESSLAAKLPLSQVSKTVLIDNNDKISFQDENPQPFHHREISDVDSEPVRSFYQNEWLKLTKQKKLSEGQVNTDLTECIGCLEREQKIKELEAHQKVQQFTMADKMGPSVETENIKSLEFEASKKVLDIYDHLKSNKIISYDDTIWFNGKIDQNTEKMIHFGLGRLRQQREIDSSS